MIVVLFIHSSLFLENLRYKELVKEIKLNYHEILNLDKFVNLKKLICVYYKDFINFPDLSKLVKLKFLNCSHNDLDKLTGLSECIKLKYLYVNNNKLT